MVDNFQDDYDPYEYACEIDTVEEVDLGLTKSKSYTVIKDNDILPLRSRLIQTIEDYTSLPRDDAILVLIYFRWDVNKIKDKWFDNTDKYLEESGVVLSSSAARTLEKAKVKQYNTDCPICFSTAQDCTRGLVALKCGHNFCFDCFQEHLKAHLEDVHSILNTTCPQAGCNLVVPETLFFTLFKPDQSLLDALSQGINKNFTDYNADVKWCPSKDCDAAVRCESKSNKEIYCVCGYVFCFKCIKEGHRPCACDMVDVWDKKNTSESENIKWITANTKQCPNCKKFIEKNQGCNHMTCQKAAGGCGHEFCWLCFANWQGHSSCNKFTLSEAEHKEQKKAEIKLELEKYIHYFDRFQNHGKSLTHALRMRNAIEYSIYHLNQLKNLSLNELEFLRDGVDTIIKSRRLLKYSYVFGYYLKQCNEKALFEHIQSKLESNADRLHELLESKSIQNLIALTDFQDFKDEFKFFRNSIVDLHTATSTFVNNLINEIENKMLHLVDYKRLEEK